MCVVVSLKLCRLDCVDVWSHIDYHQITDIIFARFSSCRRTIITVIFGTKYSYGTISDYDQIYHTIQFTCVCDDVKLCLFVVLLSIFADINCPEILNHKIMIRLCTILLYEILLLKQCTCMCVVLSLKLCRLKDIPQLCLCTTLLHSRAGYRNNITILHIYKRTELLKTLFSMEEERFNFFFYFDVCVI